MDKDLQRRVALCERADDAEWEEVVAQASRFTAAQKEFMRVHAPGVVKALWLHYGATRERCGCATPAHEQPGCSVPLVERLLLEDELD